MVLFSLVCLFNMFMENLQTKMVWCMTVKVKTRPMPWHRSVDAPVIQLYSVQSVSSGRPLNAWQLADHPFSHDWLTTDWANEVRDRQIRPTPPSQPPMVHQCNCQADRKRVAIWTPAKNLVGRKGRVALNEPGTRKKQPEGRCYEMPQNIGYVCCSWTWRSLHICSSSISK